MTHRITRVKIKLLRYLWRKVRWLRRFSLSNYMKYIEGRIDKLEKKERKLRLLKSPYGGSICDICGEATVGKGRKAAHFQAKHPEYSFRVEHRDGGYSATYVCSICQKTTGGVKGVFEHYQQYHEDRVRVEGVAR